MNYNDPENVPPVWQVGDVILDRYEVKQVFTGGGMGLVYRVHHRDWAMDLAVKSPRPEFFQTQQHIENFEREAETWVNLGLHPHTVSCYYVRRLGGIPRIFTELVDGGSLADWIRSRRLYEGGPDRAMERILDIAIQFAWGLHYAHEQGLIHQDVKPGNVLVNTDGTVKVTDFGLAKARRVSAESTPVAERAGQSILVPGSGFMTPEYASPEQLRGEHLSRKTDIWSWAVSLVEMLLGELTWTSGIAAPVALEELDDHHIDEELVAVLNCCFGAQGQTRFTSFEPALEALMCYYTSRFGSYHRQAPKAADLSSDETNNRAVSMSDLGCNEDALLTLEKALAIDPTHVLATYNYALINRRLGYKDDAFGRDALNGLLQRDSSDLTAMAAIALLCIERGIFFRAHRLYQQLRIAGGPEAPYLTEVESLLKGVSESDLRPPRVVRLCDSEIRCLRVSRDGTHLIVTDMAGDLTSYNVETGACCISLGTQYKFLTWADNNALLEHAGRVLIWNLQEKPVLLQPFRMEIPPNDHIAVSSSGLRCFVARYETLTMFDTGSGDVLWERELDDMEIVEYGVEYKILNLAFSPAGDYVAVATNRDLESMEVFDVEEGYRVDYQDYRGELLHFSADFILTTDTCHSANPLVTWDFLRSSPVDGLPSEREWESDHVTVKGIHNIMRGSRLGLASGPASNIAVLTPDRCIQILRVPQLKEAATLRWSELIEGAEVNGKPVCLGSDSRTWCVATSEGELVSFRWNEPRRAPFLIAKPASHGRLSERWRTQANLLEEAKRHFDAGAFAEALAKTSAAIVIRGGRNGEAVELHDKITSLGRKGTITALRLSFDIERTILGGQFQWIDVTSDGRCGLVERTRFSRKTNYAGDHYRLVHLPDGRMESVPDIEIAGKKVRRVSPQKDCIISATPSGFIVAPLGSAHGCPHPFSAPPIVADASKHSGDDRSPSYYTSDVQFALGGEIVVAADLAPEWCSDIGRCSEWHLYALSTGHMTRIHTNTSDIRIMPDGFHAYAACQKAIWLLKWPFQKASAYEYPDGVFGVWGSPKGAERREIRLEAIEFSSDRRKLFFADSKGGLYVSDITGGSSRGWERFDAHAEMISGMFAGADSRFLITVAADGLKIWNTADMSVVFYRDDLNPTWVSDDFRFLVEQKKGTVWELEWEYSFETPEGIEESALPHLEDFLRCRQALAEVRGIQLSWDHGACETLARELARCGCGLLSAERVNSLATSRFPYLLRPRIDPTT